MANNSDQSNNDMPFSVDLDKYGDSDVVVFGTVLHKLGKFNDVIKKISQKRGSLNNFLISTLNQELGIAVNWVEGADCEILKVGGKNWKKGKIKMELTVKFYPDEPDIEELLTSDKQELAQTESPLDDIRVLMDKLG